MKTTFVRQFLLTAVLILFSIVVVGAAFHSLLFNHLTAEEEDSLQTNANAVADLAAAYDTSGELEENWNFRMSLTFAASVSATDIVVCDDTGTIIVCSCEDFGCEHLGKVVDRSFVDRVLTDGTQFATGLIEGLYDDSRQLAAVPVISDTSGAPIGIVLVSESRAQLSGLLRQTFNIFLMTALVTLLAALLVTYILTRGQVRPLQDMAQAARRFGQGELQVRVDTGGRHTVEVDELAFAFNAMADSLEKAEIRRSGFVANVSHELKTPMTMISGFIDGILDGTIPKEREREYLQSVSEEVKRLSRLVRSMLEASRLQDQNGGQVQKQAFDLCELLGRTLLTFEHKIEDKHIEVQVELPENEVKGFADPDAITQVATNLIDNAVKFCNEGGRLRLALTQAGDRALVTVENTGQTIPEEELQLIFDRFHKTDKSRALDKDGVGLGLYIVKTILKTHGEQITVTSRDGVTAFRFTVQLAKA